MRNLLSEQDVTILGDLLRSNGEISSQQLSKNVGISLTAARVKRRELTKKYLTVTYSLNLQRYGWRQLQLQISTSEGRTVSVGKELLKLNPVVFVGGTIGEVKIDLRAEVFVRDGHELVELIDAVKALHGVKEVVWSEVADVIGTKNPPSQLETHKATKDSIGPHPIHGK
jgi:DNA-binding Lrp family transcriptional regulator